MLTGVKFDSSIISLILSTPLLLAASSSITSKIEPSSIPLNTAHSLHGLPLTGGRQFIAFAKILAQVFLPVHLEPVNR